MECLSKYLPELSQVWVWTGAIMTAVGPVMAVWGAIAKERARKIEARWTGPEITMALSRTEDNWTQCLLLIRNRRDIAMTIEEIRILRPRGARIIGPTKWDRRDVDDLAWAGKHLRLDTPVKAGPSEDQRASAKLTVFVSAGGWNPMTTPVVTRVSIRENSMRRRVSRIEVVSDTVKPAKDIDTPAVIPRRRSLWPGYGG